MNVHELLEKLGVHVEPSHDLFADCKLDAEVRIADQPRWPFECSIQDVIEVDLNEDDDPDEEGLLWAIAAGEPGAVEERDRRAALEPEPVFYVAEGRQLGYLPGAVTRELGWGRNR